MSHILVVSFQTPFLQAPSPLSYVFPILELSLSYNILYSSVPRVTGHSFDLSPRQGSPHQSRVSTTGVRILWYTKYVQGLEGRCPFLPRHTESYGPRNVVLNI